MGKLVKLLDEVEVFVSYDGGDDGRWTSLGKEVVNFPEDEYRAGLAVSSGNEWHLAEATFEDYSFVEYNFPTASPTISNAPPAYEPLTDINAPTHRTGSFQANFNNMGYDAVRRERDRERDSAQDAGVPVALFGYL